MLLTGMHVLVAIALASGQQSAPVPSSAPSPSSPSVVPSPVLIEATTDATLAEWDRKVTRMIRQGELKLRDEQPSADLTRREQWFVQLHKGVPVAGTEVWRETQGSKTVALEGSIFADVAVNPVPKLTREEALAVFIALAKGGPGPSLAPVLLVLPQLGGKFVLVYQARVFTGDELTLYSINASTGGVVSAETEVSPPQK